MAKFEVNETTRTTVFTNGMSIDIAGVTEVDNSGTYLRLTAKDGYYLINPDHVAFHVIPNVEEKVA